MATIQNFEDLIVWQKSRILCKEIFELITSGKFARDFSLRDQISRSSGAVMDNIAEGFGRMGNNEFINFLSYSYASVLETKSQLYRVLDRSYLSKDRLDELLILIEEIKKMINSLITYLDKSDFRGQKFKGRDSKKK